MSAKRVTARTVGQAPSEAEVCHVIASINTHTGGPARSVTRLAETMTSQSVLSHIFTLDYKGLGDQIGAEGVRLHSYPATFLARRFRGFQSRASRQLGRLAASGLDLIHNHGLWMFQNLYARQSAVASDLPLIISPRGMLEAWSMQRSRGKKMLAWHLYERKNLAQAVLFHATSKDEVESIRRLGLNQPIALIHNGVDVPRIDDRLPRNVLTASHPELDGKRWLLFLSRIHPKKGLDNLLLAWEELSMRFPEWQLVIAGPDLIGYRSELESLTEALKLTGRVSFTGMLEGEKKACALANAELFALPTHSENFGIAVAESLAYAVPVITTKRAPWEVLESKDCGWWIEDEKDALTATLAHGLGMPPAKRKEMGLRGQVLVESRFSWDQAAREMASVYRWVLHGGAPPDCLLFHDRLQS